LNSQFVGGDLVLKPWQFRLLSALAALCVVIVGTNAGLYFANRSAQAQLNARAQYIQQSQSIGSLYQEIAKALANLAVEHHDDEIKALLAKEGFTISAAPAESGAGGKKP
jgi:pyridoxine/pyridoxamine 5'-phosphate oxidase